MPPLWSVRPPVCQGAPQMNVTRLYFVSLECELHEDMSWSINSMSPVPGTVSLMKNNLKLMPQVQTEGFSMTKRDKTALQFK